MSIVFRSLDEADEAVKEHEAFVFRRLECRRRLQRSSTSTSASGGLEPRRPSIRVSGTIGSEAAGDQQTNDWHMVTAGAATIDSSWSAGVNGFVDCLAMVDDGENDSAAWAGVIGLPGTACTSGVTQRRWTDKSPLCAARFGTWLWPLPYDQRIG